MYILFIVLGLLALFILVILIRTFTFKVKKQLPVDESEVNFDKNKAVDCLRELIICKTVSNDNPKLEDDAEFEKLVAKLPNLYPEVFQKCSFQRFQGRALLFKLEGKNHNAPTVLMAHYDVVPVEEENWEKPPFAGIIENGVLWGRGTIDTKDTFNGVLFSANHLLKEGFVPENDMYFAFSGGEEISGPGATNIVNYFKENNITPALVVDEGGAVVQDVFPGVHIPCGMIGIAEKGLLDVKYEVISNGGHASAPKPNSPVIELSKAALAIEKHPFKSHVSKPVKEMLDTLGRYSTFLYKMIFANMWCFSWILDLYCKKTGGQLNALMRTTVAFTMMDGSKAMNVIPPKASMISNIRLNPEDSIDSAIAYLNKTIQNKDVKVSVISGDEPSPISETNCKAYNKVAKSVISTWKGCVATPYLMVQCSDSKRYGPISNHVYRFSAQDMTSEEINSIHGNNEKIRLEAIYKTIEFYIRLIKQC